MAALAPGVVRKLLASMGSTGGEQKLKMEQRRGGGALLQVTDIVPADLDEKDLWPTRGFYIKVSDSSHSVYTTLPMGQEELVLSNRLQLGQFIHVDRFDPASPVPVLVGARPIPGRHPLVGTPEPIGRVKPSSSNDKSAPSSVRRRGSWEQNNHVGVKPVTLDFGEKTPNKEGILTRASVSGALLRRTAEAKEEGSAASMRKSCSITKLSRCKSITERDPKIPKSSFLAEKLATGTPRPKLRNAARTQEDEVDSDEQSSSITVESSQYRYGENAAAKHGSGSDENISLPGKLNTLGKEALYHREAAQKVALQALRDASATESIVRVLKMFSELSSRGKPESPAACFDQFLSYHQEVVQAVKDIEAIQAATSIAETDDDTSILQERDHNSINQNGKSSANSSKSRTVSKSVSVIPEANENKVSLGKHPRSELMKHKVTPLKNGNIKGPETTDENKGPASTISMGKSIKLAKQIRSEAGRWFMEFVEAALESGLKKTKGMKSACYCPQSLILRVINWIELEQCDNSLKPIHPRTAQITRKLRIKAKNP